LITQAKVCFISSKCSFRYHVNMPPFMCRSKGSHLVIRSSYQTYISFIFIPLLYNTTHPSWFATFYNCPSFTVLVWSYHWWSGYPYTSMPMWEWTYYRPQYTSRYYCNYCLGQWNTSFQGGLPPFPSSHLTMNGYPYHKNNFQTLMHVVIIDLIHTYMVQWTLTTITHAMMMAAQEKTPSYVEWTPNNDFILVAIDHTCVFILVLIH